LRFDEDILRIMRTKAAHPQPRQSDSGCLSSQPWLPSSPTFVWHRPIPNRLLALITVIGVLVCPLQAADKNKDPDAIGDRNVGKGVNFYSLEKEIALGKQMAQEVERQAKIIDDPIVAEYVNRLGQNLVRGSDAKVPFTIKVISTDEVNAFALPGGFFFVNSGLILTTDNEAELAGVMAHEIAHVAARHGTREATRGQLVDYASLPLIFMGGWTGYALYGAASAAIPIGFLAFSRRFEKEADMLGLQYMYKAGYDPEAFVDFFEKIETMEKTQPGTIAKVFSTHPLTDDRIRDVQNNIQEYLKAKPEYVLTTSEFVDVRSRLRAIENSRVVQTEDSSRPRLRRSPGANQGPVDDNSEADQKPKSDPDERPTLKRRDDDN
jgi:predicted Zn-dependent protease